MYRKASSISRNKNHVNQNIEKISESRNTKIELQDEFGVDLLTRKNANKIVQMISFRSVKRLKQTLKALLQYSKFLILKKSKENPIVFYFYS